jgi:hypothetical protein
MTVTKKYCVYLTVYLGTKLPKRYIGKTYVQNIINGYNGSVGSKIYGDIFKNERIENPHLFKTRILSTWSTADEALDEEERLHKKYDVVNSQIYMNMTIGRAQPDATGKRRSNKTRKLMSVVQQKIWKDMSPDEKEEFKNKIYHGLSLMTDEQRIQQKKKMSVKAQERCSKMSCTQRKQQSDIMLQNVRKVTGAILDEFMEKKKNKVSGKEIQNWLKSIDIDVCYSTISGIYNRNKNKYD